MTSAGTININKHFYHRTSEAILIDARPEGKYIKGTIPSSLNITDSKFADNYKQIENLDKSDGGDNLNLIFCVGTLELFLSASFLLD